MKFIFLFLGKTKERYLDSAVSDFAGRLERYVDVEIVILKERYSRNDPEDVIRRIGGEILLAACRDNGLKVALDLSGRHFDSPGLAAVLSEWQERGLRTVYFMIGGHLGLPDTVVRRADLVWCLSRLTFTHEMTRMILLEQLYRACTINAGGRYHK